MTNHFDQLCINAAGKPKEFWNSLRPLMHSNRCAPSGYITLIENNKIIKDQNQVAEILNSNFKHVTERLPAFNLAVYVTNFVAACFHLENRQSKTARGFC